MGKGGPAMTRALRLSTAAGTVLLLVFGVGCSGSTDKAGGKKERHPRLIHVLNTRGSGEVQPFADKVAELSGGALKLVLDSGVEKGTPGSEAAAIRAVEAGKGDLAVVGVRAFHALGVNSFDALIAPLEIDSLALQQKVLASDVRKQMLSGVEHLGLEGIGLLPGPMRKPAGITRALLTPADYAGARIGFSRSVVADRSLRALGAIPVESGFEGASINTDDGIEQQVNSIAVNQYDGIVQTITINVNLWPRTLVIVANAKVFAGLSRHQQDWLRSPAGDALDATNKVQLDTEVLTAMCRRGKAQLITATTAQLEQLRAAFAPVYTWLRQDSATSHYLDEIAALRVGVTPYPQEIPSCAGIPLATTSTPSAPPRSASPFDGTYRMVTTEHDALKTDPDAPPENWGTWIFVFDRGRFAFTQENALACTWAYGTDVVHGNQIEWTFIDAGGFAPRHVLNKPGEQFVFAWSIYRDQLTLTAVPGAISPDVFFFKPWQRLSSSPAASYLNKRCPPPAGALTG